MRTAFREPVRLAKAYGSFQTWIGRKFPVQSKEMACRVFPGRIEITRGVNDSASPKHARRESRRVPYNHMARSPFSKRFGRWGWRRHARAVRSIQ